MAGRSHPRPGSLSRRHTRSHLLESLESRILFSFGVSTGSISSPSNSVLVVDNGGNLKFSVVTGGSITSTLHMGDIASIQYKVNGAYKEMLASYSLTSRYSHYEQGLGSTTKITYTVDNANGWILVTCDDSNEASGGVIQYYAVRRNDDNLYMASLPTDVNNGPGEGRFIAYLSKSVFTNVPPESNISQNTGAVEGSDVFHNADGTTASKFYSTTDMQTDLYHGVTGSNVGAFMFMGNRETSSGGPFFKDIQFQTTSAATEIYNCLFTGHTQTEPYRQGLKGPYALQFTNGSAPTPPDYSWMENLHLQGWIAAAQRGNLTGTESGVAPGHAPTITLANPNAQYWTTPDASGNYAISGIIPGTYTETLFQDQLEIGTAHVTITAGSTTTGNITSEWNNSSTLWSIGAWDGTPLGFLNSDKIQIMHPTDVRMDPWPSSTTYTIGASTPDQFPMIQAKDVNNSTRIVFTLTPQQAATNLTLRIGDTFAFAGGRPFITVNAGTATAWTSAIPAPPPNLNSRGITRGTWRGFNLLYTYDIPAGKLVAGANTIDISVASGSSGAGFLSPNIVYDAVDLVANQPPTVAQAASASPAPVTGTTTTLTVLGADDSREANLVYNWSSTGPAAVTYSNNGSNAAKITTATFTAPGTYTFTATIKDASGRTVTSSTSVNVVRTATGFGIAPASATVLPGGTLQLVAGALDQFGTLMTPASNVSWSLTSGPGALSPTGLFLAPATPGDTTTIQASAAGNVASTTITVAAATALYTANDGNTSTLTDSSGNNQNAPLTPPISYTPGVSGNALSLSGGFAQLPAGIVSSLSDFTISAWINVSSLSNWQRIFDFGTGTTSYMFLSPDAGGTNKIRFAITTSGGSGEQRLDGPALSANTWTHIAVTLAGQLATLYVDGQPVATNPNMTLSPAALGNTALNYLGKSQFPNDPALLGAIDDFRIYPVPLSADQVLELAAPTLIAPASTPSSTLFTNSASLAVSATDVTAGESALTYTWSTLNTPPAPVTFDNNGTNAAKNTTATFTRAGVYTLQVAIKNPAANITTTSTLTLSVFPGDANQDGKIDLSDLSTVLNHIGANTSDWTSGNFDGAPTVDLTDLSYVLNNFGQALTPAASPASATQSLATLPATPQAPAPSSEPAPAPTPIDTPTTTLVSAQLPTESQQPPLPTPASAQTPPPAAPPIAAKKPPHHAPIKHKTPAKHPPKPPKAFIPFHGHYRWFGGRR
ncbi:MAG: rhamnogalacturonan lyase B N-terminal domain-containing protein [Phycisphaerae bacterium]